ncbi:protein PRD1 isoform X2 [Dendrobium catenatum]|uniref:protein PRD1 isoform X2 n=1 Tax=Dendrobium catenatum TaxID=906689 RepID=UPI00109FD13F|nr:protein PRD1 isoform X2 [Dendrobium catenatum]
MEQFSPASSCSKGHRRSLAVETAAGGSICLSCFAALVSDSRSPTHHVSYALSQLNLTFDDPDLLLELRERHAYLLVAPLVAALSAFDDEPLARQVMDVISDLCFRGEIRRLGLGGVSEKFTASSLSGDFIARIADRLASGALAWSRRHIYLLHCFGVLLNSHQGSSPAAHIREQDALFSNLLFGLQLPSEELRGEVLFVIYKLCQLNVTPWENVDDDENDCVESLDAMASSLWRLALEILLKTQHDEVRINCLALLLVLVGKGLFQNLFVDNIPGIDIKETKANGDGLMQQCPLITLFSDAIKGSLLSSDEGIQISTLDLIFHMISPENCSINQLRVLVEENIPDYIFEILRLSGNKDPVVISCLQLLALFSTSEEVFKQKLVVGFSTLLSVLHYTSQIPLHPVQPHALTLVCNCISYSPGIMSISQVTEVALILTCILRRCMNGELPETFILACSTFVEILKSPSAYGIKKIGDMIKEASRCAVLSSLSFPQGNPAALMMHSLALLKEAHAYSRREDGSGNSDEELEENIMVTCQNYLLPWLEKIINEEVEEDVIQEIVQTFHLVLLSGSEAQTQTFANNLISSNLLTLCFAYLGLFPTDQMRSSVYLILGSLIDRAFGPSFGQPLRDALFYLPVDPLDLIFLLGQKSSIDPQLALCQRASLLLLYVSSLSGERFADDTQVLASLEQYILVNSNNFFCGTGDSLMLAQLVHLYGLYRGSQRDEKMSYSPEAEKTLLNLLARDDLELFSFGIHPMALKWLFQQERIMTYLSNQILKFCRLSRANESQLIVYSYGSQTMNMQLISELVVSGDNYVAQLLVSLLRELQGEGGEDDMICVLNTMTEILKKFSDASIQLCMHSFSGAIRSIYYSPNCSPQLFSSCSLLVFHVLYTTSHNVLSQEGEWLAVTVKCLVEMLSRISDQRERNQEELRCSARYLQSMIAVMESLVFYEEKAVATNCGICLSKILSCKSLGLGEKMVIRNCKWFRMIMEEFTMTLTAPSMASKYFKNLHKPASRIATALLRLEQTPQWMRSVFDISCISGVVSNLCAQNLSAEMVDLFRALLSRKYLNEEHVGCLNQIFQVCRKQAYKDSSKGKAHDSSANSFISSNADFGKICNLLVHLMMSPVYREKETDQERLLREIDMFYRELSIDGRCE